MGWVLFNFISGLSFLLLGYLFQLQFALTTLLYPNTDQYEWCPARTEKYKASVIYVVFSAIGFAFIIRATFSEWEDTYYKWIVASVFPFLIVFIVGMWMVYFAISTHPLTEDSCGTPDEEFYLNIVILGSGVIGALFLVASFYKVVGTPVE